MAQERALEEELKYRLESAEEAWKLGSQLWRRSRSLGFTDSAAWPLCWRQLNRYYEAGCASSAQQSWVIRVRMQGALAAQAYEELLLSSLTGKLNLATALEQWSVDMERGAEGVRRLLTFKLALSWQDGFLRAVELENGLSEQEWKAWCSGDYAPLCRLLGGAEAQVAGDLWPLAQEKIGLLLDYLQEGGSLISPGCSFNIRACLPMDARVVTELDCTLFPGRQVTFEAEVETDSPEEHRHILLEAARDAGVTLVPSTLAKHARFLKALAREQDRLQSSSEADRLG